MGRTTTLANRTKSLCQESSSRPRSSTARVDIVLYISMVARVLALRARANHGPTAMAVLAAPTSRRRLPGPPFRHQIQGCHSAAALCQTVNACQAASSSGSSLYLQGAHSIRFVTSRYSNPPVVNSRGGPSTVSLGVVLGAVAQRVA